MRLALVVLAIAGGAAAQDLAPETILVARIKDHLREQIAHLPDYTCLEDITRYHRRPGPRAQLLLPLDRLQLEVLYSGSHEWYGWPGARTLDESDPVKFIGGGMIGNGLFALFQKDLLGSATTYTYRGEEPAGGQSGGRPAVKYDFRVPRLVAGPKISLVTGAGTVGLKGSFWADPRTFDLQRLTVTADDVPEYLPLSDMSVRVDYVHTRIGPSDILLAQNADLHMRELSGEENYDHFEFTHCSQFHAQSSVSFESAPSLHTAESAGRSPPAEIDEEKVPALLLVTVQLRTAITANDILGTPIEGRTSGDVLRKGKVVIPDGSTLRGRIRRLEQSGLKPGYFVVGLEFTEIEIAGAPMRFYADLVKLDRRGGIQDTFSSRIFQPDYPGVSQEAVETVHIAEIPGVASFFAPGPALALPQDFWTVWRTRGVLHH